MRDALLLDVKYARRALAARPLSSAAVVVSLAVAIAANTAILTVVNAALFGSVPGVTASDGLVEISRDVRGEWRDVPFPALEVIRAEHGVVQGAAGAAFGSVAVAAAGPPVSRAGLAVTASYFRTLGVGVALGRTFRADEAEFPAMRPVVVVSFDVWRNELGGAPDAIGSTVRVNGRPLEVIGVLPEGFGGHRGGLAVDVFIPLGLDVPGLPSPGTLRSDTDVLEVLGRLQPGVSPQQAEDRLSTIVRAADSDQLASEPGGPPTRVRVRPWGPLPAPVRGAASALLSVLELIVALALGMAGLNVTMLLVGRADARRRELSLRQALGASHVRVVRQLAVESVVLFLAASAAGLLLSLWATRAIAALAPTLPVPGRLELHLSPDGRVLLVSMFATLGACLAFGVLPAARCVGRDLIGALRDVGAPEVPGRMRLRHILVGLQVGATTLLIAVAGLFARALSDVNRHSSGWMDRPVLVTSLDVTLDGSDRGRGQVFYASLLERTRGTPGVDAAALATKLPLGGRSSFGPVTTDTPAEQGGLDATLNRVSSGYLRTMGIPLLAGRDFLDADGEGAPLVAIINEALAGRLWPGGRAIGSTMRAFNRTFTVVGVAGAAPYDSLAEAPLDFYYVPIAQWYNPELVLHARVEPAQLEAVATAIGAIVRDLDPDLPVPPAQPLEEALAAFLLPQRLATWVAGATGAFSLTLALVGIYAITAFVLTRRTREIAIRLALGATRGQVFQLMFRRNAFAPAAGFAAGTCASVAAAHLLPTIVAGVRSDDLVALGLVPIGLMAVAVLAICVPLLRALRVEPAVSLRAE